MRRLAAIWVLLCAVPSGPVWLAGGAAETQACAMACAHASGEEVCCPLDETPAGQPLVKSCAPDQRIALHRASNAVLSASSRLSPPVAGEPLPAAPDPRPEGPEPSSLDHVPLRIS
ncbi:MAG TPA: hypothetical protein VIB08_07380 [Thermoanaerobaculia bacterium]